jgi:hypothetical protein
MIFPVCAKCSRSVSRMTQFQDFSDQTLVFIAECHGEEEQTRLSVHDVENGLKGISAGVAFVPRLIGREP